MAAAIPGPHVSMVLMIIIRRGLVTIHSDGNSSAFSFTNTIESLSVLDCYVACPCALWSLTPSTRKHKGQKSLFTVSSLVVIYKTSSALSVFTICTKITARTPHLSFKTISTPQGHSPKDPSSPASANSLQASSWPYIQISCTPMDHLRSLQSNFNMSPCFFPYRWPAMHFQQESGKEKSPRERTRMTLKACQSSTVIYTS